VTAPEDGLLAAAEEYRQAAEVLRALTREGREVIQEMRATRREMDDRLARVQPLVQRAVNEDVTAVIQAHLDALQKELVPFREAVLAKIDDHWRHYSDILLGRARETSSPHKRPIDEIAALIATRATSAGLPSTLGEIPAAFDPPSSVSQRRAAARKRR
jgi:hypothetical protein